MNFTRSIALSVSLVLSTLIATSSPCHAIFQENWERPIKSAEMEIINSSQRLEDLRDIQLTLAKRDGASTPTSLSFEFIKDGKRFQTKFKILSQTAEDSTHVVIRAIVPSLDSTETVPHYVMFSGARMVLTETNDAWNAKIILNSNLHIESSPSLPRETLEIKGNPETLFTIMAPAMN